MIYDDDFLAEIVHSIQVLFYNGFYPESHFEKHSKTPLNHEQILKGKARQKTKKLNLFEYHKHLNTVVWLKRFKGGCHASLHQLRGHSKTWHLYMKNIFAHVRSYSLVTLGQMIYF